MAGEEASGLNSVMALDGNDRPGSTDRLRTLLLRFFLGSIAANAAFGVWALLAGDFGQTEGKVLATSLLISAATLAVLVNGAPIQRRVLWPVPALAAVSAAGAFGLLIVLMWAELDENVPLKVVATGLIAGSGGTLAGLLALISLLPRYERLKLFNNVLISVLVVTAVWGVWAELDKSWYARTLGVESVLVAATTLTIPVLWRFGGDPGDDGRLAASRPPARAGQRLVGSLVSPQVVSVKPTTTLRETIDVLAHEGVSLVAVVDSGSVSGVVSEHDVLLAIDDNADIDEIRAADIMSTSLVVADDKTTTSEAARLMSESGVRHLLVLGDDGGVVSALDLLSEMSLRDQVPET